MKGRRLWVGLAVSVLLGMGAAVWPAVSMETSKHQTIDPPGDRVRAAIEELRVDRVHVPPDGRSMLDEAAEERVEELIADADPAIYVIVWAETSDAGYGSPYDVVDQVGAAIDPRAVIVVWEGPGRGDVDVFEGYVYSSMEFEGEPEARIRELVEELDGDSVEPPEGEDAGDIIAGVLLGSMTAGTAYGLLMMVVGFVRLPFGRPFLVPGPKQGDR
ncbi:hypothetical protein [Nocardioides sp. cx-173]|uniref:hypothetical protein n=1 Tax=Nocardioides sp. cx-173 TaxID=2898796 RepID=UPI001E658013|nr:hypothetical protein [Nocardioides sp. cx-173]MCD4525892.1 hypothetical protein [Nocardioides sp. cx-173]UGB40043.1 hypothetical protein LQ940_11590 [Nocardioides sp. cx-173]